MSNTGRLTGASRFDFGPQGYVPLRALRFTTELPTAALRLTVQPARRLLCDALPEPLVTPTPPRAQPKRR